MAGGVATKGNTLVMAALAAATTAVRELTIASGNGLVTTGAAPYLAGKVDPAVSAAITALTAIT